MYSMVTVCPCWGWAPVPSWVVVLVTAMIACVWEKDLVVVKMLFGLVMDDLVVAEREESRGARRVKNIMMYGGVGRVSEEGYGTGIVQV